MKVRQVKVSDITPYWRNPRISDRTRERLMESIQRFGFNQPVAVDSELVLIAGHARWSAARALEMKTIPAVVLEHLSESEARAYRIADNKLHELSTWDDGKLLEELGALEPDLIEFAFEPQDWDALTAALTINVEHDSVSENDLSRVGKGLSDYKGDMDDPTIITLQCPHCTKSFAVRSTSAAAAIAKGRVLTTVPEEGVI